MAETKISALAGAAALSGGEKIPAVQSGANVALTPNHLAAFLGGRTWYVASGGSDANSGLSPVAPFATLAKVLSVLATRDTVLLKCGGTWRESFDISGFGRVTVGSYGSGTRPVIDGADVVTESWTLVSGNVYRVLITYPEATFSTQAYPGMFENGLLLTEFDNTIDNLTSTAARVAAVQARPGSFNLESPNAYGVNQNANTVYSYLVQASDGGNPASNGSLYEVRKRNYTITHAGALISGITFRRSSGHNGAQMQANTTLPGRWTSCVFDQMPRHHTIDSFSDYYDCIATRPNPKYPGGYMFHAYGQAGIANTKRYVRCKAIGDGVTLVSGFGTHSSSLGTSAQKRLVFEDCENYGNLGFSGFDCDYMDIVRPRNRDCIKDIGVSPNVLARVIDGDFLGANGTEAISPPTAGKTLQLIRTRIVANTTKAFARTSQNAGTIDVQEGCELLWNAQPVVPSTPTTAFFLSDGNFAWDRIKARRSILGNIGGIKSNFALVTTGGNTVNAWDIDDCLVGGLLAAVAGTNRRMQPVLQSVINNVTSSLIGTAGFGAGIQLMANLRKLYSGDPVRDGPGKRVGANWPFHPGFNAVDGWASTGNPTLFAGKALWGAATGFKSGQPILTPTSELFAVKWINVSTAVAAGANGLILISTNYGASFAPATGSGLTANTLRGIAFSGTTVVIVGDGGVVLRSTDSGATFTLLAAPGGSTDLAAVAYGNGAFVACGAGGVVQYSTDGSTGTWTQVTAGSSAMTWRGICWASGPAVFTIVGDVTGTGGGYAVLYTSPTGATWTGRTIPTHAQLVAVASDGTTVAAVGRLKSPQGPELITSTAPASNAWTGSALRLPFDANAIAYVGNDTDRWSIAGRSPGGAFAYEATSHWEVEQVAPIDPAALRASRTGPDGWLATL